MKNAVYAAADVAFDTKNERLLFPKGSLIHFELFNGDVFIVHHKLVEKEVEKEGEKTKEQVVEPKVYKFLRLEDLKFALDCVILDSQLSDTVDFRDAKLDDVLMTERIPPGFVLSYTIDTTSPFEKKYQKEGDDIIRLPVRIRSKEMNSQEKIKELASFGNSDDEVLFKNFVEITSVTSRIEGNANKIGYLVHLSALNDLNPYLPSYLESKLREGLPKDWRINRVIKTNEDTGEEERTDTIRVYTNGAPFAQVEQLLSTIPLTVVWNKNEQKEAFEIDIGEVELPEVVETYFTQPVYSESYTLIDGEEKKEGAKCVNEQGDVGVLVMQNSKLICMTKESYVPDFSDSIKVGDPCRTESGLIGSIQEHDGGLACVCKDWEETSHTEFECSVAEAERKAGDMCKKGDLQGQLQFGPDGKLVCKVPGHTEVVGYTIPKIDEAESYHGYPLSPGASPKPGDPCDYQGKPGTLALINGALICALGGQKPKGADGAN